MKKLLFTDLDGTLLELDTYSCEVVRDSVTRLKNAGISIIFCSSKTWAEQEFYLKELQLDEPVIVENGSGILLPGNSDLSFINHKISILGDQKAVVLGKPYEEILQALQGEAKTHYPTLKFYANQSLEEITKITGLTAEAAQKAKIRSFSETIFNADLNSEFYFSFEKSLNLHSLQCIPGSRYVTITGSGSDKGKAVKILTEAYQHEYGEVISYGAGDSQNDLEMLKEVDFPYLVQRPDGGWANCDIQKVTKVGAIGPDGWNIMANEILLEED